LSVAVIILLTKKWWSIKVTAARWSFGGVTYSSSLHSPSGVKGIC